MERLIIPIILLFFVACEKADNRICWKINGKTTAISHSFNQSINKLQVMDDINVTLIHDSLNMYEITGPSNLVNLISLTENDDEITFKNKNKCDFLRANKEINVSFHYSELKIIHLNGYGSLSNNKEITHPIEIKAENVLSNIDLLLNNDSTNILISRGSSEVILKGNCTNLYVYNSGLSPVKTFSLSTLNTHINSNTISKTEINVTGKLNAEIRNSGNIYYSGNPTSIKSTISGTGKIIAI